MDYSIIEKLVQMMQKQKLTYSSANNPVDRHIKMVERKRWSYTRRNWYLNIDSVISGEKGKKTTGYFFSMVTRRSQIESEEEQKK